MKQTLRPFNFDLPISKMYSFCIVDRLKQDKTDLK